MEKFNHSGLTDRELAIVSVLAKHIKERIRNYKGVKHGWNKLLKDIEELMILADNGLTTSLINKLYHSSS